MLGIVAGITLLIVSVVLVVFLMQIVRLFLSARESSIIHFGFIITCLAFTFLIGGIGVILNWDQINHPGFQVNVIIFSLHYLGLGMVYRSLNPNSGVLTADYALILLMLAPSYGMAILLGAPFVPMVAFLSQMIPIVVVLYFERHLYHQFSEAIQYVRNPADKHLALVLSRIFRIASIFHWIGISAFVAFIVFSQTGQIDVIDQIWVEDWNLFDYIYYAALVVLLLLFVWLMRMFSKFSNLVSESNFEFLINSILN